MARLSLSCEEEESLRRDLVRKELMNVFLVIKKGMMELEEKNKSPTSNFWNYHAKNVCSTRPQGDAISLVDLCLNR